MRRSTFKRDVIGTLFIFVVLSGLTFVIMLGEHFLDNFKAH